MNLERHSLRGAVDVVTGVSLALKNHINGTGPVGRAELVFFSHMVVQRVSNLGSRRILRRPAGDLAKYSVRHVDL